MDFRTFADLSLQQSTADDDHLHWPAGHRSAARLHYFPELSEPDNFLHQVLRQAAEEALTSAQSAQTQARLFGLLFALVTTAGVLMNVAVLAAVLGDRFMRRSAVNTLILNLVSRDF